MQNKLQAILPTCCLTLCHLCCLVITFVNSHKLEPDQARQDVGPDFDPNCFDSQIVILKYFFSKKLSLKKSADDKKACKITQ